METEVSESADGDQLLSDKMKGLNGKLVVARERIIFVDSPESEEFNLLLIALQGTKIVAMDAEWKSVRRAGVSPRVSILQLSCRINNNSRFWAPIRTFIVSRKVAPGAKESLGVERLTQQKDMQILGEDARNQCEELQIEKQGMDSQRDRLNRWRAEIMKKGTDEIQSKEKAKGTVRATVWHDEDDDQILTLMKIEDGLKNLKLAKNDEVDSIGTDSCNHILPIEGQQTLQKQPPGIGGLSGREGVSEEEDEEITYDSADEIELEMEVQGNQDWDVIKDLPWKSNGNYVAGKITEEERESIGGEEVIFVLDLLTLSAANFASPLKKMLCSPRVLKLGFAFKQDQQNLAASFPGPEANGCFDKVEPYVDIAKLYKQLLQIRSATAKHRGKRFVVGGTHSLAGITREILGVGLCKDSQCSDWEQRPLSQKQIEYAAADTQCLLSLFDALLADALTTISLPAAPVPTMAGNKPSLLTTQGASSLHVTRGAGLKLFTDEFQGKFSNADIFTHKMGIATEMVEAALFESHLPSPQLFAVEEQGNLFLRYDEFVKRYSERLLVGEESRNKSRVPRPRGRRARDALRNPDAKEEYLNWVGPAPWDARIGGDGKPKFLCDVMVEALARQLRCIGMDAASPTSKKSDSRQLVERVVREGRVLLTKDIKLLRRQLIPDNMAYFVKKMGKWEQLEEVTELFKIQVPESPQLSRCIKCNGEFIPKPLSSQEAMAAAPWEQEIPAAVLETCREFWQCSVCHHVFWQVHFFFRERLRSMVYKADSKEGTTTATEGQRFR